jgi:hypothetical protein
MQRALIQQIRRSKKFAAWRSRTRELFRERPTLTDTKGYKPHDAIQFLNDITYLPNLPLRGASTETIRKIFENKTGVLIAGTNRTRTMAT